MIVNKNFNASIIALIVLFVGISCNTNEEPVCSITHPENNALYEQGESVVISVSAEDADGNITEVKFIVNENLIGSVTSAPFSFSWNTSNASVGNYRIRVEVIDDGGKTSFDEISIDIYGGNIFIDSRDNQEYQITEIDEKIWFAENLNYDLDEYGVYDYEDNAENSEIYGKLYRLEFARESCPDGWHLPNKSEWVELISFVGGEDVAGGKLKETDTVHWNILYKNN